MKVQISVRTKREYPKKKPFLPLGFGGYIPSNHCLLIIQYVAFVNFIVYDVHNATYSRHPFSLFRHFLVITFQLFILHVWLRIVDEGPVQEMRIWSISLI